MHVTGLCWQNNPVLGVFTEDIRLSDIFRKVYTRMAPAWKKEKNKTKHETTHIAIQNHLLFSCWNPGFVLLMQDYSWKNVIY